MYLIFEEINQIFSLTKILSWLNKQWSLSKRLMVFCNVLAISVFFNQYNRFMDHTSRTSLFGGGSVGNYYLQTEAGWNDIRNIYFSFRVHGESTKALPIVLLLLQFYTPMRGTGHFDVLCSKRFLSFLTFVICWKQLWMQENFSHISLIYLCRYTIHLYLIQNKKHISAEKIKLHLVVTSRMSKKIKVQV